MDNPFANSNKVRPSSTWRRSAFMLLIVTALILLAACGGQQAAEPAIIVLPTATLTLAPTSAPTATITLMPTITPTPRLPVSLGTPMPVSGLPISSDNLEQVTELGRWGSGVITDAAYSPDGKLIAAGSTLGVSIYETVALKEILYFETTLNVNSIAFSPDGKTLVTGLNDKTVKTWSVADGSLLRTFEYPKNEKGTEKEIEEASKKDVNSVAFSPDGKLLAAGSADGMVILWQVSDGSVIQFDKGLVGGDWYSKILAHISRVFFSPDGQSLFSASWNGKTRMISIADGKQQQVFTGQWIADAVLSSDGKILVMLEEYARSDPKLTFWNVEDGKKIQTIKAGDFYGIGITGIALSPDNQYVAAAWNDYSAKIWSVTSGVLQNDFQDLVPKDLYYYGYFSITFDPDGKSLLMAGRNIMAIWNPNTGSLTQSITTKSEPTYDLAMSLDGKSVAAVEGTIVKLSQVADGKLISIPGDQLQSNGSVDFSPDGNSLLMSTFKNTALMMPLSDQSVRKSFEMEKKERIWGVAFSPDGKTVALGASSPGGKIEFRQTSDGLLLATTVLNVIYGFNNMEFSASGEFLGVSIDNQTILIRVSDGKVIKSYKGGISVSISPDSTLLAAGTDDKVLRVWKIPGGETIFTLKDRPEAVSSVRFSPDGKLLIAGMSDGIIEVWNVSDGTLLKTWQAHSQRITDFVFSLGGDLLFSSSYDGTIRVWGLKP